MSKSLPMVRNQFIQINNRRLMNGLTIKEFCEQEGYSLNSFNYWLKKYRLSKSYNKKELPEGTFSEIKLSDSKPDAANNPLPSPHIDNEEISLDFPNGFHIRFSGKSNSATAMDLVAKILSANVLP